MPLPLGALTAPHGTHSSVNAGLLARTKDRIFLCLISEQRVDVRRRDFLRRIPGRAVPIKTHLLVQRSLAEHEQLAQSRVQPRPSCAEDEGRNTVGMVGC